MWTICQSSKERGVQAAALTEIQHSEGAGQPLLTRQSLCLPLKTDEMCLTVLRKNKEIRMPRIFLSQIKTYKEVMVMSLKQIIAQKSTSLLTNK